ncbi:PRC-barrel domain-containing protein [Paracoccus subflavus]|nr:PRC-barrel domain-containing protein [Paracoccus subflavus]
MRNLMLSTAIMLPLMMVPALGQDTTTPPAADATTAPAGTTTDTMETPMGTDTAPAADPAMNAEADMDADAEDAEAAAVAASGKVEQQQAEDEQRIDWITGTTVMSPDGETIGDINDVIIDMDEGTLKAAVIGVGGFLGIGEKRIAVPWDQLTFDYDAQQITSDLSREEADAAPEYVFRAQADAPAVTDGAAGTAPMDSTTTAPGAMPADTAAPATTTDPAVTPDAAAATNGDAAMTGAPTPAETTDMPEAEAEAGADVEAEVGTDMEMGTEGTEMEAGTEMETDAETETEAPEGIAPAN